MRMTNGLPPKSVILFVNSGLRRAVVSQKTLLKRGGFGEIFVRIVDAAPFFCYFYPRSKLSRKGELRKEVALTLTK